MNWVDKLERKYGHLAPEGLIRYISALIVFVFILNSSNLLTYQKLALNGHLILSGEVWRIVTFALIPVSTNFLFLIFELSILILCADGLEANWGTFKLGLYYVFGLFFISLASLLSPYVYLPGSYFIYLSLFLGFATLYPDYEILLFLILPVKVKYMAGFSAIMVLYSIFKTPEYGFALLLCLGNYILFLVQAYITASSKTSFADKILRVLRVHQAKRPHTDTNAVYVERLINLILKCNSDIALARLAVKKGLLFVWSI